MYVSVGVFKEILTNQFCLSEVSDRDYKVCLTLFVERQKEFHLAVTLLNSWYACLIDIRNAEARQTGVNLDDKLPKNFINFTLASVSSNYDLAAIKQYFPDALEVTEEALNQKLSHFSNCQCHKDFRGKYEIQFLLALIELILQDANKTQKYLKNKINFSFGERIGNLQAITIFSGYAETPESLIAYLKQVTESEC